VSNWPKGTRKWTSKEITNDCIKAKEDFRRRRLDEPKVNYLRSFREFEKATASTINKFNALFSRSIKPSVLAASIKDRHLFDALRYIGAPPISKDDLKTLSESKLSWTKIEKNRDEAKRILKIIRRTIDPKRFPWIVKRRKPKRNEKKAAILATTVVVAVQRIQTQRRMTEKSLVETAVEKIIEDNGFLKVESPKQGIQALVSDAPAPGKFMKNILVGQDMADFIVGLRNGKFLIIECKGSNNEVNSRKRINKDVMQNARHWRDQFGTQIIPSAAIQGVFKDVYIKDAQETPVVFFWAHRLSDLKKIIK